MKNPISFLRRIDNIFILGILILSAFIRFYRIQDYMTFLGDEGRDVLVVYNILHGNFTLLGPTASVGGFFLGPIYYYFMAPFLWLFNYNPVGPAVMVAFFGIVTVFLVYKIGSEFFNTRTGIVASLLYAISPLVVAYSRSSWNPNLMPFFTLLTLYALYKALNKDSKALFILSGFLFGILMQLHYIATFVGAIIIAYILFTRILSLRENIKLLVLKKILIDYLLIFIGFIVGWSPFLAFEVRHGYPNSISVINFIFHSSDVSGGGNFFAIVWDVFFRLFGRLVTKFPPPEQFSQPAYVNIITIWYWLTFILMLTSVLLFLYQYLRAFKSKDNKFQQLSLIALWLFLGVFIFGFYKKPIYDYYFGFMFPLPFFLVGNLITYSYTYKNVGKILSIIIFVSLAWINLTGVPFRFPANRQLAQAETISRFVYQKTDQKPYNFALITGGNSDHAYRYFFKIWNHDPIIIENPQNDPKRKTVTNQLLVVCEKSLCEPLGYPTWEVAGFGRAEIAESWDISVVKVYKLVHYKGK
ncbi:MAG: glycosyltransferase family 39 protein [Candidatus Levybacteria bacterium]|nr:glycosyltransferase family 39 protein [Candidatus Levybacteria bacterium]